MSCQCAYVDIACFFLYQKRFIKHFYSQAYLGYLEMDLTRKCILRCRRVKRERECCACEMAKERLLNGAIFLYIYMYIYIYVHSYNLLHYAFWKGYM